jgi:aryl-alcohol dehydrogenase-like predicted oxidoreductase
MKYRTLGNTNLEVSLICLGTMTYGEQNTQQEGLEQLDYAFDQGVNFYDTAEMYSIPPKKETYGATERVISHWDKFKTQRDKVILATKAVGPMWDTYIRGGEEKFNEDHLTKALHGSLERLGTDYIDLYQLHWPERKTNFFGHLGFSGDELKEEKEWTPFEETLQVLKKFQDQGKIRYVGLSNETPFGVMKYLEAHNRDSSLPRMASIQNPYNLLNRSYEVGLS